LLLVAASLGAAAAPHASASSQRPADPASDRRPGAWIAAVRAHQPGRSDDALVRIAAWRQAEVERILPQVAAEPDAARLLARGLVLHADIGIVEHAGGVAGGVRVMTVVDGRASGNRGVSRQWGLGRVIAATLVGSRGTPQPGPAAREAWERERRESLDLVRHWYRATAAVLQEDGHLGFVHAHANAGLSLLGDDAVLLMYRATLRQAFADPRLQMYARPRPAAGTGTVEHAAHLASGPVGFRAQPQQASFELDQAARDLRRALELDPRLVEARIRLAHVLSDRHRHDEAATLLRPVMETTLSPFLDYYGALVLGRVEERLGRLPEALAAYQRAGRRFPEAQVPRVALSRLALLDGRPADGLDLLRRPPAPTAGGEPPEDPWWWYFRAHEPNADTLVDAMREAVR
jgi:tetratricopeptide (TPR) repeat protein